MTLSRNMVISHKKVSAGMDMLPVQAVLLHGDTTEKWGPSGTEMWQQERPEAWLKTELSVPFSSMIVSLSHPRMPTDLIRVDLSKSLLVSTNNILPCYNI